MEETLNNLLASAKSAFGWLETELFSAGETAVTYGSIVKFLVIVIVTYIASRLIQNALGRFADYRGTMTQSSVYALKRITHYLIMVIGFLIAVSSVGIDLTKFAIFASALGIGVGFGLQNLISNFTAGIMLLFDKTLKVGDFVELESGVTGEVQAINIRSTVITTNDNIDIVVPNSEFVNGRVTNWTMRDTYRRIHVKFGVAYGSDKEKVREAVLEAADRVPFTLSGTSHRPPQVWLNEFGDSALNFELVVWLKPEAVNRPGAVHAAFMWEIHSSLMEYDIQIPFPQRDIHVRSWIKDEDMQKEIEKQKGAAATQNKHPGNDAAEDI